MKIIGNFGMQTDIEKLAQRFVVFARVNECWQLESEEQCVKMIAEVEKLSRGKFGKEKKYKQRGVNIWRVK